jgi:hypothetical protein
MNGLARHLIKPRLTDGFGEKKKKINMSHKSTSPLRTMDKPYED